MQLGKADVQDTYVMQRGRGIKFGIAGNAQERWSTFKTAAPSPIYILGVIADGDRKLEDILHGQFDFCRIDHPLVGQEWFNLHWELVLWLYLHGFKPVWTFDFITGFLWYNMKTVIIGP